MPSVVRPKMGKGQFQWNAGGWLGATVGGTSWMLVTAGFLVSNQEVAVAAVPFSCFLIASLFAYGLWMRRGQLDPFLSLMALLAVLSIATPVAWLTTRYWASQETLARMSWPSWYGWNVVVLLLVPAIMAWFSVAEAKARRLNASHDTQ